MKNNLPNIWLDEIDIEECRGTEYHWCSHNQKDTFNICYIPKEKYDLAVMALKYIANSAPSAEQTFEIENKLAAQQALSELGE